MPRPLRRFRRRRFLGSLLAVCLSVPVPVARRRGTGFAAVRIRSRARPRAGSGRRAAHRARRGPPRDHRRRRRMVLVVPHHGPVLHRQRGSQALPRHEVRVAQGQLVARKTTTTRSSSATPRSRATRISSCSTPTGACSTRRIRKSSRRRRTTIPRRCARSSSSGRRARRQRPRCRASAHATCSRTSGDGSSGARRERGDDRGLARRVAERRPRGCATSARSRCGGSRCLPSASSNSSLGPREKRDEIGVVEAVAHGESGFRRNAARTGSTGRRAGSRRSRRSRLPISGRSSSGMLPACSIVRYEMQRRASSS